MPNVFNEHEMGMYSAEIGMFEWPLTAAIASPGTLAETSIGLIGPGPYPISIGSVQIHPSAALTANNSNYVTITVFKRPGGGAATAIASVTTQITGSGNWVAWTPVNLNVVAGAFVSPGDSITVTIVATGTGVGVPQLYLAGFPKMI